MGVKKRRDIASKDARERSDRYQLPKKVCQGSRENSSVSLWQPSLPESGREAESERCFRLDKLSAEERKWERRKDKGKKERNAGRRVGTTEKKNPKKEKKKKKRKVHKKKVKQINKARWGEEIEVAQKRRKKRREERKKEGENKNQK